jgi:hypothetical protein
MLMMRASYMGLSHSARLFCNLASPNGCDEPTLGLGSGICRVAEEDGADRVDDRHNYTFFAPTFSGFTVPTDLGRF